MIKNKIKTICCLILLVPILIILSSCGGKDVKGPDADLGTGEGSSDGSGSSGGGTTSGGDSGGTETGGATGSSRDVSDLTTLWVYLPYTSPQIDSETGEEFDGSFNRPLPSLEAAVSKIETLADEGVTVDTINIYTGSSDSGENVVITTTGLTISGGFYCKDVDGSVINMETNLNSCESMTQVDQYVMESVEDFEEEKLSLVKGTITINADMNLDQVSVMLATQSDGSVGTGALLINDASPTIEYGMITVPDGIKNAESNSIAIAIEATEKPTNPVITKNLIQVGNEGTTGSTRFYGIRANGEEGFEDNLAPQIEKNEITIYPTTLISAGLMITRKNLPNDEETSQPIIHENSVTVESIPFSFGIYTTGTASRISKNKITVSGSSSGLVASGIAMNKLSGETQLSQIYTNLIRINSSAESMVANGIITETNAEIYANTFIYTKGTDSTSLYSAPVVIDNSTFSPTLKIVSNIFMATESASQTGVTHTQSSSDFDNISNLYNNLFDDNFKFATGSTTPKILSMTSTSIVQNNKNGTPDLDSGYKPTSSSPALDTGFSFNTGLGITASSGPSRPSDHLSGPTTDIDGNSRDYNDAPDIGCYEYQGE